MHAVDSDATAMRDRMRILALGYGSFGSGFYVNPIREPGEFLAGALPR